MDIPKIKKKVNAFLVGEEGKISKESLIKTGAVLTMFALGSIKSANAGCPVGRGNGHFDHCNDMRFQRTSNEPSVVAGTHRNEMHNNGHSSHNSHGSHSANY